MNSLLYAGNSTPITTEANGTVIPFYSIVRRYGKNLNISGGNVVMRGTGYYGGDASITYTGTTAGTVTFAVYKDGVLVPFSAKSATTAENVRNTITIPFKELDKCCGESTLTVVATGAVVNVVNSSISVDKY